MTDARWIYALSDPLPDNESPATLLGGKGLSLRRMADAGLPVPPGFTITTEACRAALAAGIWPDGLDEQLEEALHDLNKVNRAEKSEELRLAVRSGAEVSMPGMLETILDCESSMTELRNAVRSVFESWHSERARAWRARQQIDDSGGTAVTVQQFVETVCSGVLFTKTPQSESDRDGSDEQMMLVEIVRGRGDALVSGNVTPRVFTIDRRIQSEASVSPIGDSDEAFAEMGITRSQLLSLARTGLNLEEQFGEPLDIEWGLIESGFVFFQSRPIPHASAAVAEAQVSQSRIDQFCDAETHRLGALLASGRVLVRHNLAESLPAPTPMTWSIVRRMMSGAGGLGRLYRMLGYSPGRRVSTEGFLELVAGRPFADPDRLVQLFATEWPLCHDYESLKKEPQSLHEAPRHFDPDRTHPLLLLMLPHLAFVVVRSTRRIRSLMKTADSRFRVALSEWSAWVDEEKKRNLYECSRKQLIEIFEARVRQTVDMFAADSLLPGTVGAIAASELHRRVTQRAGVDQADSLHSELLSSVSNPLIERQTTLLESAARGEEALTQFLAEFGHRGPGEMELSNPRWNERHPETSLAESTPRHARAEPVNNLPSSFEKAGLNWVSEFTSLAETAQRLLPFREAGRHELMRGFSLIREVLQKLAQRTSLGMDIYFLEAEELMALGPVDSWQKKIAQRKEDIDAAGQLSVPDFIDADSLKEIARMTGRQVAEEGETFQGAVLSRGQCTGRVVRLSVTDSAMSRVPSGAVIVADSLDPALVPAMLQAAGVIVEQGGVLSHGAVVARQLGIPVLRCAEAARSLADGQSVAIDWEACRVTSDSQVAD